MEKCLFIMTKREKWGKKWGLTPTLVEVEKKIKNLGTEIWNIGNRKRIFVGMKGVIKVADDKKTEKWCTENKTNKLYPGIYATFEITKINNDDDESIEIEVIDNFYNKGNIINKEKVDELMGDNYFSSQSTRYFNLDVYEKIKNFGLSINIDNISDIKSSDLSAISNETERESIIKSRIGQSNFRKRLLTKYKKCSVCGIENNNFLIASHIKPWSECTTSEERTDFENNGLLLCAQHDKLFDKGYISFETSGDIIISKSLNINEYKLLNINSNFKLGIEIRDKMKSYLKYHRELNKKLLEN